MSKNSLKKIRESLMVSKSEVGACQKSKCISNYYCTYRAGIAMSSGDKEAHY